MGRHVRGCGGLAMLAHIIFLEHLGWRALRPMYRYHYFCFIHRGHKHCPRYLDADNTSISALGPANVVVEEVGGSTHVLSRHGVSCLYHEWFCNILIFRHSTTIVTIFRLDSVLHTDRSKANITWDVVNSAKWSSIEMSVGIACSCIPSIRFFLVRLLPSVLRSKYDQSHEANQYGDSQGKSSKYGFFSLEDSVKKSECNTINCTTTVTVDIESKPVDEIELVRMSESVRSGGSI
jgi:hypothetical protein